MPYSYTAPNAEKNNQQKNDKGNWSQMLFACFGQDIPPLKKKFKKPKALIYHACTDKISKYNIF